MDKETRALLATLPNNRDQRDQGLLSPGYEPAGDRLERELGCRATDRVASAALEGLYSAVQPAIDDEAAATRSDAPLR